MSVFKPYSDYKDSGVDSLGKIPSHWTTCSLRHHTKSKCDGPFGSGLKSEHYTQDGTLVVRLQNIKEAGYRRGSPAYISESYFDSDLKRHEVLPGDLLIAGLGDDQNVVGRACVAPDDIGKAMVKADCFRFRLNAQHSPSFFAALLNTTATVDSAQLASGSTRQRIPLSTMASRRVVIPSPEEQTAIAGFLDRECAKLDHLRAKQDRLIELLKEKRQALISHAVTRGLDPNAKLKPSGIEWLGDVPKHWSVAGFTKFISSTVDYRGRTPEKTDSGVFLVTARNIKNGRIDYDIAQEWITKESYDTIMLRGKPLIGDVLFTTEAPLGEVAQIDRADIGLAQRIIKFRGHPEYLRNDFLKYFILSTAFQSGLYSYATGSTALGIKAERLIYLRQVLPPLDEQQAIVAHLVAECAKIHALLSKTQQAIDLLKERRTSLIAAAVTGKIDVREHVPSESLFATDYPIAGQR